MGKLSFNGTGTFNINTAGQPVVTGTVISSATFNLLTADLGTGLSTCLTKDGQSTPTANIPMGTYKLTGLGVATATGDALSFGRVATISTLTLTTPLATASGGTALASFTSGGALYATSTTALTTGTLPVASGGTGAVTFTDGGVMIGNVTGAIQVTTAGTVGQVLTSNGSGVDPTFQSAAPKYAIIQDQRSQGTAGGTVGATATSSGAWTKRTLNTEASDPDGIVSISSSAFTLAAGTYEILATASTERQAVDAGMYSTALRIRNTTDSTSPGAGDNVSLGYDATDNITDSADIIVYAAFTIAGSKTFELQQFVTANSGVARFNAGIAINLANYGVEIYATVFIKKVA